MPRLRRLLARFLTRHTPLWQRCLALHMRGATYRSELN
jgi:hypothetical protein